MLNKLAFSLDVLVRLRPVVGIGRPHIVELPSVANVTRGCTGFMRWQDTCEARARDTRLLDMLIRRWRRVITDECDASRAGGAPIVFDAGRSLCWNVYKSRFATHCVEHYPFCSKMLKALRWNRVITRLQDRVLRGIARYQANATSHALQGIAQHSGAAHGWAAVHVRAFVCAWNKREPKFDHVATTLAKMGVRNGLLYVVSSVPVEQVQAALPQYRVIAKSTFLGRDVRLKYPFEVLAAVDYGVAVAAPLYLGEPMMSSFDAFAQEERRRRGKTLDAVPSTCGAGAGPGA